MTFLNKTRLVAIAATFGTFAMAKVTGPTVESLGLKQNKVEFKAWLAEPQALHTPETTQLALQSCFRASQQGLDALAYEVTKQAVGEMKKVYRRDIDVPVDSPEFKGMIALTELLSDIDAIQPKEKYPRPSDYETACRATVSKSLSDRESELAVVYAGRMHPSVPESLASRNLRLTPLSWNGLTEQICKLEGYYSTSYNPALWKFFSLTRAMMNVLPAESRSDAFVTAARRAPQVAPLLRAIDQYSAIAGKYNGATLSMSEQEAARAPMRMTGPALGSKATSLLAFFTTAWRERLQAITMERPYPAQPFQLVSLSETLGALQSQFSERANHELSATEVGMEATAKGLMSTKYLPSRQLFRAVYGPGTEDFRATASLAWLALNAETNIRQNEKLPGLEATSVEPPPVITTQVFGAQSAYRALLEQITNARKAYGAVDKDGSSTPACVKGLETFAQAAANIADETVGKVDGSAVYVFDDIKFEPVIADIGQEVNDDEDGIFRLHLAIGYGREFPIAVKGSQYTAWSPSAFVLHLSALTSTSEWQSQLVQQYDKSDNP